MKSRCARTSWLISIIRAAFFLSLAALNIQFVQATTIYDNGIALSDVNNGRVNNAGTGFGIYGDNFSLTSSAQVNEVSWLGGYKGANNLPDNFTIEFFAFNGGTPATAPFATFDVGAVSRQSTSQTLIGGASIYSYSTEIAPAELSAGTYLIAIVNDVSPSTPWFWADEDAPSGNSYLMLPGESWRDFSGGGVAEFAFSISNVPEATSGALLLSISIVLCGIGRRHLNAKMNG